jgi:5'-3' exonuclease
MGLKQVRFIDWFQLKFPNAIKVIPTNQCANFDSVFIDVNCILHPAMRTAKNEAMFVKKLFIILDRLLAQFIPGRICYFSVDGPAPLAKLLTQKARRAAAVSIFFSFPVG